jgi:hypothetical protein
MSIKNGESIVIHKVENGYIVEALEDDMDRVLVFNDMGYASGTRDDSNVPALLKFIEQHFSE